VAFESVVCSGGSTQIRRDPAVGRVMAGQRLVGRDSWAVAGE